MSTGSPEDKSGASQLNLRLNSAESAQTTNGMAGADQVLAVYNDRLAEADFVTLAASGTRGARPRRSCFRARLRGHRAQISCPYQPFMRSTLHAGSKHAEILSKQAEILLKQMEKTRKTVDWLVTFASISQAQHPCAYAG